MPDVRGGIKFEITQKKPVVIKPQVFLYQFYLSYFSTSAKAASEAKFLNSRSVTADSFNEES